MARGREDDVLPFDSLSMDVVRIVEDGRAAVVRLSLAGVVHEFRLSFESCRERLFREFGLRGISDVRFRRSLERLGSSFALDPRSVLPWEEQFLQLLRADLAADYPLSVSLRYSLESEVHRVDDAFARACGQSDRKVSEELVSVYCGGVNRLTMDDDYIAVCRGGQVVERIALEGNDENELKNFLRQGGDIVLSPENVHEYREAVRMARKRAAYAMARASSSCGMAMGVDSDW